MNNCFKYVFGSLVAACLLVVIQTGFCVAPDVKLGGVEIKAIFPEFSLDRLIKGDFQSKLSQWLSENIGFRSLMVRLDNQIYYSLFNEISDESIVLGKENWLYETNYIHSYNRSYLESRSELEAKVLEMKRLQERLVSRGIQFLFIITPSKVSIYPEYLKPDYVQKHNHGKQQNYRNMLPLLDKHGIKYLDGHKLIADLKSSSPYPVFPKSGTHWNYVAALHFTNALISEMETALDRSLLTIQCESLETTSVPFREDADIARVSNILSNQLLDNTYLYPKTSNAPHSETTETGKPTTIKSDKPKLLFVGGSFLWAVLYYLDTHQVYSERDMFFYFKRNYQYPENINAEIQLDQLDWENDIFKKDMIILEANEINIGKWIGSGFMKAAIEELDAGYGVLYDLIDSKEKQHLHTSGVSQFEQLHTQKWRWAEGPQTRIDFHLPQETALCLSFRLYSFIENQHIKIEIMGEEKATYNLTEQCFFSDRIYYRGTAGENTIIFKYTDWNHKAFPFEKNDPRKLAVQFFELQLLGMDGGPGRRNAR